MPNIKNQKEEKRTALIRALWLPKDTKALILCYVNDHALRDFLIRACDAIGVKMLLNHDELAIEGADAFITDDISREVPLKVLLQNIVVPIVPLSASSEGFVEFNPMKFEWNAFFFEIANEFQMFASLVRYLENIRYPGDKRTLLANVSESL